MGEITPIHGQNTTIDRLTPSRPVEVSPSAGGAKADTVELSEAARLAAKLDDVPAVRQDLIEQIRASIADGSYEDDSKIDTAIENLAEDLGG